MAYIILRDIPKYKVGLDLLNFPVQGEFRGFQNVLGGYHEIRVYESDRKIYRAEIIFPINSINAVQVLVLQGNTLVHDHSKEAEIMVEMASSSVLNGTLINPLEPATKTSALNWFTATSYIDCPLDEISFGQNHSPHPEISRFKEFWRYHGGNAQAALREFQAVFAKMILHDDIVAVERIKYLVQAHYNAGESGIALAPDYFIKFSQTLKAIFTFCYSALIEDSAFVVGANYLIEDMIDYGEEEDNEELVTAAKEFAKPLKELRLI